MLATALPSQRPASASPQARVQGRSLLLAIGLWFAIACCMAAATLAPLAAFAPSWQPGSGPQALVSAEVYLALPIALLVCFGGPASVRERLALRYTGPGVLLGSFGLGLLVLVGVALLYVLLSPFIGSPSAILLDVLRSGTDLPRLHTTDVVLLVLIVLRSTLLSALAEELLYRGALFGWLRQRFAARWTILVTSVLFAAQHFFPLIIGWAFVYALVAGWVRERTGSTLNTMALHLANDATMLGVAVLLVATGHA